MTYADLLAASGLAKADAETLLAAAVRRDRAWLHAHAHDAADPEVAGTFMGYAKRRQDGEPVAYILGEKEFYGRSFAVGPGVLVPRPCTEELVAIALAMLDGEDVPAMREIDAGIACATAALGPLEDVRAIVDVGTGSGCIAVSMACECAGFRVIATDVSLAALETAQRNAERHGVLERFEFRKGEGLSTLAGLDEPFLVVTNPPYVADETLLGEDVRLHEPREALMGGGADGADILRMIVAEAAAHPYCRGIVAECLVTQAPIVSSLAPRPT